MELPIYLRTVEGRTELARTLGDVCEDLGFSSVSVLSGTEISHTLALELVEALGEASKSAPHRILDNTLRTVGQISEDDALLDADAVIAVGGGKVIDTAKAVCLGLELPVVVVPTLLSADGIASPVSVLEDDSGRIDSHPAKLPIALLVDLGVVARGPVSSARAGFGDLLSNRSALIDWRLADERGEERVDDFAALLSEAACELAWSSDISSLGRGDPDREFLRRLLHGLVLSGLAMEIAGSSRPCSGAEHLISHSMDRDFPGTAAHGEQVAFGTVVATALRQGDWRSLQNRLLEAGMDAAARGFGLSPEQVAQIVQAAPDTRPGRYTVLDEVDLGSESLIDVLGELFGR